MRATAFGRVVGVGPDHGFKGPCEFGDVNEQLLPLWARTRHSVPIPRAALVATTAAQPILLAHLKELPSDHEAVVHTP